MEGEPGAMSRTQKTMEEFRKDLMKLPEQVRKSQVRKVLRKEATILTKVARKHAEVTGGYYKTRTGEKISKKTFTHTEIKNRTAKGSGGYTAFMNLNDSIKRYSNKKNKDLIYEVIGVTNFRKGGAYYAVWQMLGSKYYSGVPYKGKGYIEKTNDSKGNAVLIKKIDTALDKVWNKKFVAK